MPLIFQHRIYRQDLQANLDVLYVFGDNAQRVGLGGQAGEMRGEPNAVGVATKWAPSNADDAFFSDEKFELQAQIINQDMTPIVQALVAGKTVVWPLDGIGTGLSDVPNRSPKTYEFLNEWMDKLGELG